MRVVILDEATLNIKELLMYAIGPRGEVIIYPKINESKDSEGYIDEIVEKIGDSKIILCNKAVISKEVMDRCENLEYIGVLATGYDNVDVEYAAKKGIVVTNVPSYSAPSVAQATIALLLELTNQVGLHSKSVYDGEWCESKNFCYFKSPIIELAGKTMGIIGYGSIGSATGKVAQALGMKVLAYKRNIDRSLETDTLKFVDDLDYLLENSDVISLHCPATEETTNIINKETLEKMKNTAYLINTSRGKLVVEEDLKEALNNDKIAGAALDVICVEPMEKNNPLLSAKNCIITPHIAWGAEEAKNRLSTIAANNVKSFIDGDIVNKVN